MSLADHGIYMNLRGEACVCGDPKLPGKSFCRRDYFKLPQPMRSALYQRAGYPAAFRDALKFLGLDEPVSEEAGSQRSEVSGLERAFPHRGSVHRYRRPFR